MIIDLQTYTKYSTYNEIITKVSASKSKTSLQNLLQLCKILQL